MSTEEYLCAKCGGEHDETTTHVKDGRHYCDECALSFAFDTSVDDLKASLLGQILPRDPEFEALLDAAVTKARGGR